jgi:phytoene dehydrogenase-like protein
MADVFAERLKSLGGRIITGDSVTEIMVDGRTVAGIGLESGDRLYAPIVVGAVHPQVVLHMLPMGAVRPSYRKRITNLKNTEGIFGVHASLDADAHPETPHNIFKIDTDPNGKVNDLLYFQLRRSIKPGVNTLSVLTSGKADLWRPWESTLSGHRGEAYLALKQKESQGLIKEAEAFFGPLKGLNILDAYTPLTVRDWVNSPDGSAYGVMRSASQSLTTALLNRTSVKGLYLAGQSVLAPGVIGTLMGSFATVKLIMGAKAFRERVQIG